jgi:hypothetical protein
MPNHRQDPSGSSEAYTDASPVVEALQPVQAVCDHTATIHMLLGRLATLVRIVAPDVASHIDDAQAHSAAAVRSLRQAWQQAQGAR